jgi:hypothetical protein
VLAELLERGTAQERISLNSSACTSPVSAAHAGRSAGGPGGRARKTRDNRDSLDASVSGTQFRTLTAAPLSDPKQAGDGDITMSSAGTRLCNGTAS